MSCEAQEGVRHAKLASLSAGLGVVGLITMVVCPSGWTLYALLTAIVLGHVTRYRIRRSEGRLSGMKTALIGCVLGYGVIVVNVLIPAPGNSPSRGRLTTLMNNGRNLYVSLFAHTWQNPFQEPAWPQQVTEDGLVYSNSTEFFRWVVTTGVMNVEFSFFAGPGVPPVKSTNAAAFNAENNAWCVVSGVNSNTPDGMPVLFTRNLGVTNLNQLTGRIQYTLDKRSPLELDGVPIISNGGSAQIVGKKQYRERWEDVLPNYDAWYGDHPVLRP